MAEAYAKSLLPEKDRERISSSGIEAKLDLNGAVSDSVPVLLEEDTARQYLKAQWTQTTQQHIDSVDVIVFLSKTVYQDATKFLEIPKEKALLWNIPDKDGIYPIIKTEVKNLLSHINA